MDPDPSPSASTILENAVTPSFAFFSFSGVFASPGHVHTVSTFRSDPRPENAIAEFDTSSTFAIDTYSNETMYLCIPCDSSAIFLNAAVAVRVNALGSATDNFEPRRYRHDP